MQATLEVPADADTIATVMAAVGPELEDGPPGTATVMRADDGCIVVTMEASDLGGLRAAMHNVTRLVDVALRTANA